MSDDAPEGLPAPPPESGAMLPALEELSRKLDTVAGAVATIAAGHTQLLDHVAEAEARRGHDSMDVAGRLAAIERQLLGGGAEGEDAPHEDVERVLARLDAIERALAAMPGAAPGVESTFVALADRLDALADGEREGREQLAELVRAVEGLRRGDEDGDEPPTDPPGVDRLRDELVALTEAQRAVSDELAGLGPRINELLERHPDGLPLPPTPAEGAEAVEAAPPLDLSPLQEQVALLAETTSSQGKDLDLALEVLTKVAEAIDRLDARTDDRLAAIRDASTAPLGDLQALLAARSERSDAQLAQVAELLAALVEAQAEAPPDPALDDASVPPADDDEGEAAQERAAADAVVLERLDDLTQAVQSLTWQIPELADAVAALQPDDEADDEDSAAASVADPVQEPAPGHDLEVAGQAVLVRLDEIARAVDSLAEPPPAPTVVAPPSGDPLLEARLTHHIDTALAGVLRLIDDRLVALRSALSTTAVGAGPPPSAMGGFEAGAVMGAAQAAWNRLEQRLDSEFDDLSRQLEAMAALIEQAVASTEAVANRPVVTGDQLRKAATSLKETVVNANRQRRERRGGPKGLGPGDRSY